MRDSVIPVVLLPCCLWFCRVHRLLKPSLRPLQIRFNQLRAYPSAPETLSNLSSDAAPGEGVEDNIPRVGYHAAFPCMRQRGSQALTGAGSNACAATWPGRPWREGVCAFSMPTLFPSRSKRRGRMGPALSCCLRWNCWRSGRLWFPPPRFHLLRYHGVLAPRARARERIVPAQPVAEPAARRTARRALRPAAIGCGGRPCWRGCFPPTSANARPVAGACGSSPP